MRSVGAVATTCSCAASAQLATFRLGGFVLRDERWLEELRTKYDEKRRGSCDAACSVPSLCWGKRLLGGSWARLDQMKNFGAASAQLATFLLGGFVLRDEHWLEERRTKYDEQRRGSCDAACSVPSLS